MIVWIDWFEWVQVVHDVEMRETELVFKMKNIKVWDQCDLPDYTIPLDDCVEDEY